MFFNLYGTHFPSCIWTSLKFCLLVMGQRPYQNKLLKTEVKKRKKCWLPAFPSFLTIVLMLKVPFTSIVVLVAKVDREQAAQNMQSNL